jgi:isoamylase
MTDWTTVEGSPLPLGATWVESAQAWNGGLYSKHAESVSLLLYAESDLVAAGRNRSQVERRTIHGD